jgi:Short C-terminal domain
MADPAPAPRQHRGLVSALIVLATVLGVLAVFAVWAERQALETDTWTDTSSELLENEEIRTAIAGFLVDELYANVDVQAALEQRLPPQADALAGPAAGGIRQLANQAAVEALGRPRLQGLWEEANRRAHERLLAVLEDDSAVLERQGDDVVLELGSLLEQVADRAGIDPAVVSKLPPEVAGMTILKSDDIALAQDAVTVLKGLAIVLAILALGLFALAVYLARGRRRETLRSVGIAFVLIGIIVLVARGLAGNAVVGALASTASVEPPAEAAWDIGTSLLRAGALAMIGYGVAIILGAWLAGPSRPATALRRGLAPYLRDRWTAYAGAGVIVLLVLWWNPTPGTSRLLPTLVLLGLFIAGVEALRSLTQREFPDAERGELWASIREARAGRSGAGEAPGGGRLGDLERLAELHRAGALDDEEFAREKQRVLGPA